MVTISQPEIIELYRGYKNIIEIGFRSGCEFKIGIACSNSDTVYNVEDNKFIVVPGPTRNAFLEVYKILDDGQYELVSRTEYRVRDLPDPTIYFGAGEQEHPIYWNVSKMYARYSPEIWLNYSYEISNWNIKIGNKNYTGKGNVITSEVQKRIKKMRKGKKIDVKVTVIGENKQERVIETFFTRAPNEWYKNIEDELE